MPMPSSSLISFQYIVQDIIVDDEINNNVNNVANENCIEYDPRLGIEISRQNATNQNVRAIQHERTATPSVGVDGSDTHAQQNLR